MNSQSQITIQSHPSHPKATFESMRFENATFNYDGGASVFSDLTFDLPLNRVVLIGGAPGGGQSTFLKLLSVLLQPQKGSFLINGQNTTNMSFEEFLMYRLRIGYSFDYGGLFANRTLHENLTLPLLYHKICSAEEASAEARKMAEHFGFSAQANTRPASVSGGLRKLVCILRAFITKPELIAMDDPFSGLNSASASKLIRMVFEKRESGELKHLFFTSRDDVYSERLGYEKLIIENGKPYFGEAVTEQKSSDGKVA